MRTIRTKNIFRLLVGIGLVTLTANLFGQLFVEERMLCMHHTDEPSYSTIYMGDLTRVESTPTATAESGMIEEKLSLEPWMTIPFEKGIDEENLRVESWMKIPFESVETIEIQDWMTDVWILSV